MAPLNNSHISTMANAADDRTTNNAQLSLSTMHIDLLPAVLSKMDFKSLTNCRRASSRINEYTKTHRKCIKSRMHVEWIRITETGIFIGRWGKAEVPEEETMALRPRKIQFFKTSSKRILAINLNSLCDLEEVELIHLEEEAANTLLSKLTKTVVPTSLKVSTENAFEYNNSFTTHPAFNAIGNIDIGKACSSPDLSFLTSSNHGSIHLINENVSNIMTVIKAIQMICAGLLSTSYIGFCLENDVDATAAIESALTGKLIWSYETHKQSVFKKHKRDSFSSRFPSLRFYALPMVGGRIGGLCTSKYGGHLRFKVFNSEEEFLKRIPQGAAF